MYRGDHEFESDSYPGTSSGRCAHVMARKDGTTYKCGADWTSVLHPPDQFRHWCSALEAGGDCMHFEDVDVVDSSGLPPSREVSPMPPVFPLSECWDFPDAVMHRFTCPHIAGTGECKPVPVPNPPTTDEHRLVMKAYEAVVRMQEGEEVPGFSAIPIETVFPRHEQAN